MNTPAQEKRLITELARKSEQIRLALHLGQSPVAFDWSVGPRVRFVGIAGTLLVGNRTVQVVPKFAVADSPWQDMLLVILSRARRHYTYSRAELPDRAKRLSFIDHMALAYSNAVAEAARGDPIRAYAAREETAPYLRGRLDLGRQMSHALTRPGRLYCIVDYLDSDNEYNRLLLWAFGRFESLVADPEVRQRLHEAGQLVPPGNTPYGRIPSRLPIQAPSQFGHFGEALEIASTLASGFQQGQGRGDDQGYGYVLNMDRLFEKFVAASVGIALSKLRGKLTRVEQLTQLFAKPYSARSRAYFTRPDNVIFQNDVPIAVVDAKYKRLGDSEEGPRTRPHNTDIYQMMASSVAHGVDRGLLLYPWQGSGQQTAEMESWTVPLNARPLLIAALGIDLAQLRTRSDLEQLDQRLANHLQAFLVEGVRGTRTSDG